MSSRRSAKVAQAILECVSSTILLELKDPRVKNVTVTGAEVSGDFRSAKIKVSIMGDEKTQALSLRGLESARGFLQAKVAERLETRYTPILKFVVDRGVKLSIETSAILRDLNLSPQTEEVHDAADETNVSDLDVEPEALLGPAPTTSEPVDKPPPAPACRTGEPASTVCNSRNPAVFEN
jgi:ribosome-binding factor A